MGRKHRELTAFIDGASSGNPGHAGAAVVFHDASGKEIKVLSVYLGETTNNVAEYRALVLALEKAKELGVRRLIVHSDSELLVKQFAGQYRVKNAGLRPHFERAKELQGGFESLEVHHVSRGENRRADQLARQAVSRRSSSRQEEIPPASTNRLVRGALAVNEVSLLPRWSDLLPAQVRTETSLAGDIDLEIPLLSVSVASRESVTLATAVAQRGGIAILRPARTSRAQTDVVKGVKASKRKSHPTGRDYEGGYRIGALVYPSEDLLDRVGALVEVGVDLLILEASLGHGPELIEGIAAIKKQFPMVPLIAGDVTDIYGAQRALESGADVIKVGAPFILGVKVPLFTAIQNCVPVAEKYGRTLVADVGTSRLMMASSRIARAVGAGAHAALVTFEPAETSEKAGILAEGLDNLIEDVKMIMSCCGARTVEELRRNAKFVRVRGAEET